MVLFRARPVSPSAEPPQEGDPAGSVRGEDLLGIERVLNQAAIGAARTSLRVQTLARDSQRIGTSSSDIQGALSGLGGNIQAAAQAARDGAGSTRHMADLTREGLQASEQSVETVHELRRQTGLTDTRLQALFDEILARDPRLVFALVIDLNAYGPTHNKRFEQDWTGLPEKDLAGNRVKRFFTDNRVLVRGARHRLGEAAEGLPERSPREAFRRAGAWLDEPEGGCRDFLVQTYARDTGALMTVLTVPLYVMGQRYGASLLGWTEEAS